MSLAYPKAYSRTLQGKNSSKKPFNKGFKSSRLKALKHFNEKTVCDNYSFW